MRYAIAKSKGVGTVQATRCESGPWVQEPKHLVQLVREVQTELRKRETSADGVKRSLETELRRLQKEIDNRVNGVATGLLGTTTHVGAVSFDAILRRTKAKCVLGLTATPIRRDGQQPIIFMQCGPIRHTAARPAGAPHDLEVVPRSRFAEISLPPATGIQDVFRYLATDDERTRAIAAEIKDAFVQGRKVLVLTERTEHLDAIRAALDGQTPTPLVLHGRMSRKQRGSLNAELDALPADAPRVLLATGKLVGEGFDHPALDTLVLAMPVSWKGTLQQYAGRLHREHAGKPTSESSILSIPVIRPCCECGRGGSAGIVQWGIAWVPQIHPTSWSTAGVALRSTESRPIVAHRRGNRVISVGIPAIGETITSSTSRRIRMGTAG